MASVEDTPNNDDDAKTPAPARHRADIGDALRTPLEALGFTADDVAAMDLDTQRALVEQLCPAKLQISFSLGGRSSALQVQHLGEVIVDDSAATTAATAATQTAE